MSRHLLMEIENLKRRMLHLGGVVERAFREAVESIRARDPERAEHVVADDAEIDRLEVELEEDCLKALALHQPVAVDLRYVIAILKINNDLERIGDLAANIAERAIFLAARPRIDMPFDFAGMADRTRDMLKRSLDALVLEDPDLAAAVCRDDDEVDRINREMYEKVKKGIERNPERLDSYINIFGVSRQIERIADHATNIAEDVIYTLKGDIIRHGHGEPKAKSERSPSPPGLNGNG